MAPLQCPPPEDDPRPFSNPFRASLLSLEPVAYWPFTDGSGDAAADIVGGANASLTGGFSWIQDGPTGDNLNDAVRFDGNDGEGEAPHSPAFNLNVLTAVLWMRRHAGFTNLDTIFQRRLLTDPFRRHWRFLWQTSPDRNRFDFAPEQSSLGVEDPGGIPSVSNQWFFIAGRIHRSPNDVTISDLYRNAELVATATWEDDTVPPNTQPVDFGSDGGDRFAPVDIAHAALFDRILAQPELSLLYSAATT